jgi:hypothetical protein
MECKCGDFGAAFMDWRSEGWLPGNQPKQFLEFNRDNFKTPLEPRANFHYATERQEFIIIILEKSKSVTINRQFCIWLSKWANQGE